MKVPAREEAAAILAEGEAKALAAARSFLAGERFFKALSLAKFGPFGSRLMRAGFAIGVKRLWSHFKVSAACSSCGLCARCCPTGSIVMQDGHPRWSAGCEQCMRCLNLCPSRAILQLEAIGKGSGRERWIEPHFKPCG
jgi:ferredoxin